MKFTGAFILLILSDFSASATTWQSDGSQANVQKLHDNSAQDGDTITLPAGTFGWTQPVRITKSITLQGQSNVTGAGTANWSDDRATTVLDDTPRSGSNALIIDVNVAANKSVRITGITFAAGATTQFNEAAIHLQSRDTAPNRSMRVDHCHFASLYYGKAIWTLGWVYGVADHNVIECRSSGLSFHIWHDTWGGPTRGQSGEGSWADFPYYGTEKFFFIEDNTIIGVSAQTSGSIDTWKGGRYVARHNYFLNSSPNSHGTEGNAPRGARCSEVYDNIFNWTYNQRSRQLRSGSMLYHDNKWIGLPSSDGFHTRFGIFRVAGAVGNDLSLWGLAVGTNRWDRNDPHGLYETGTTTNGSINGEQGRITDSSKNWTPNQWAGYSVINANPAAACYNHGSYIIANTATTITYAFYPDTDRGARLIFNPGDTFSIYRVLTALDQPGRGKGDLIYLDRTGHPLNATCHCHAWPNQALEPCFSWNNMHVQNGQSLGFGSAGLPTEIAGRDYHNLGTGLGTETTPSQVSSTYTAALNGVDYISPFIYPHPLVSGAPIPAATARSPQPLPKRTKTGKKEKKEKKEKKVKGNLLNAIAEHLLLGNLRLFSDERVFVHDIGNQEMVFGPTSASCFCDWVIRY